MPILSDWSVYISIDIDELYFPSNRKHTFVSLHLIYKYRGSPLHTVSVHTDSHHTVFSGPPRQGFDGFYGTLNFKNLL